MNSLLSRVWDIERPMTFTENRQLDLKVRTFKFRETRTDLSIYESFTFFYVVKSQGDTNLKKT